MPWKSNWAMAPCACVLPEVSYIASFLLITLILRELRGTYRNLGIATSRLPYCFSRRFPIRCTDLNWHHEVLCDYGVFLMSSAVRLWVRSACGRAVVSCHCFIFIAVVIGFRAREFFLFVLLYSQRVLSKPFMWDLTRAATWPLWIACGYLGYFDVISWRGTKGKAARRKCCFIALALSRVMVSFKG